MAAPGVWAPIAMRVLRHTFKKASNLLKSRLSEAVRRPVSGELQPVLVRNRLRHPVHPAARLRQTKSGRWYTTHSTINAALRRYMSTVRTHALKYDRAVFPSSATATAVSRLTTRAPFASTLRPNLTGGALSRTSGGYGLGGGRTNGARYFSHTPAAPAQVINNVSSAMRAFWLSGQKARFDGLTPSGEKKYRNISMAQDEASRRMQCAAKGAPGSFIDFCISPTVTALSPLGATFPFGPVVEQSSPNLNTEGFLDVLSVDFSRALKDYAAIMNDLKRLSSLGDLSITLEAKSVIRVHFPGCDADTVERLCDEVGIQRGVIHEDADFDSTAGCHMALKFPHASTSDYSLSSPGGSLRSQDSNGFEEVVEIDENLWPESYETMEASDSGSAYFTKSSDHHDSSDYEGLEGIYKFLEQCDKSRRI